MHSFIWISFLPRKSWDLECRVQTVKIPSSRGSQAAWLSQVLALGPPGELVGHSIFSD